MGVVPEWAAAGRHRGADTRREGAACRRPASGAAAEEDNRKGVAGNRKGMGDNPAAGADGATTISHSFFVCFFLGKNISIIIINKKFNQSHGK